MNRCLKIAFFIAILFIAISNTMAQATYNMSNATVNDCYGIFLDSDAGTPATNYAHNENFTFRICVPGANTITMTFTAFCTEPVLDVIRFFNGPDTFSTLLGTYSGNTLPGTIVATSGCLTIHFKSDANVACTGWSANWMVNLPPPVPPTLAAIPNVNCFSSTLALTLSQSIPCDSIYPGAFTITGPGNPVVVGATAAPCTGGNATSMQLSVNPGISQNGNYLVTFVYNFRDICDSLWVFTITRNFTVTNCPIVANIISSTDTVCFGECLTLQATATGGDPPTYTYAWSNGLPNSAGPHVVCPTSTTTYSVIVNDAGPSPPDTAYKTIIVVPKPNAGIDQTVCRNASQFFLAGIPAGGTWSGNGVINGATGLFRPWVAGTGTHQIYYTLNGCTDTLIMTVLPIWAGPDQAACPGSPAFLVSSFSPAGGIWAGTNITPAGVFNPLTPGTYSLTYTAPNGCSDIKVIRVDSIILQANDTTCINLTSYSLAFTPIGGVWSGTGIINATTGIFNPSTAGAGTHILTYTINGCVAQVSINVQSINAGPNRVSCPYQVPFNLPAATPAGGYWVGMGITDSIAGTFDPGANGGANFTDYIVYHFGLCTDTMIMYVRRTVIALDTAFFCVNDSNFTLDFINTGRNPSTGGSWSGPGVINPSANGIFSPSVAGPGVYSIFYSANTCIDSMVMVVYNLPQTQADTIVCQTSPPFLLSVSPSGGSWSGTGITNASNGTFSPAVSGLGYFEIVYTTNVGCTDTMYVQVDPLVTINIMGLAPGYCYNNTPVNISATPVGGIFSGPGVNGTVFNPINAGPGIHYVVYNFGSGNCAVADSVQVIVGPPLSVAMGFTIDSICYGDNINISAVAGGGLGIGYTYSWSHGLGAGQTHTVSPTSTTIYTVTVSDGCTQPVQGTLTVYVHRPIVATGVVSPKVCYGQLGWAKVVTPPGSNYSFIWNTTPVQTSDSISEFQGNYSVTITDNNSGCFVVRPAVIDGWPLINAQFSTNPNQNCVSYLVPVFNFLDNSVGGISGTWDFGDGNIRPYVQGNNPAYTYADTGVFNVVLTISNQGGCTSSYSVEVCIEPDKTIYVPNGFTPNDDGKNDFFKARGIGIAEFQMMIFNRWGEKLFESNDMEIGWDGYYRGEKVQNDVYTYLIIYKDITSPDTKYVKGVVAVVR